MANHAADAAQRLAALDDAPRRALVGFDGFIDTIIHVVDERRDMSPEGYTRIRSIAQFARRCADRAGRSGNIELVDRDVRWGGNAPLLAGAIGRLGLDVTCIGAVASKDDPDSLHPVFAPLAALCSRVIPIAHPGRTDAFEFDDGKLMFNRTAEVQRVTWESLTRRVGVHDLALLLDGCALLGLTNWSLLGGVEEIWRRLAGEVLPRIRPAARPHLFVDLSDPAKRTDNDVRRMLCTLADLNRLAPLTLGLNLAEADRIASVLALARTSDRERMAGEITRAADVTNIVIHHRDGAVAAYAERSARWATRTIASPAITTGAGDHFNAGFAFGLAHGWPPGPTLSLACSVAHHYVATGCAPDRAAVLRSLAGR